MSKICSESVPIPIKIVFEESLKKIKSLEIKKKANVVSAHQKEDKTLLEDYCLISKLPIFD